MSAPTVYRGVFPIAPTQFHTAESVDEEGMRRVIDFMIDAGVDGRHTLANYSEQFALTHAERDHLQTICLEQVDPLIRRANVARLSL